MLKRALGAILVAALLLLVHQVSLMNSNEEPAPAQGASEVRRGTSQMEPTAGIEIPPDLRGDSSETTAASLELGSTGVVVSSGSTAGAPPPPPPPPPPEPTGPTEVSLLDGCEIEESGSGEGSLLVVSNLYSCDVCARPVHPPGCLCADVYDPKSRRILRQNLTLNTLNNRNGNKLETKLAFPARSPWRFTRDSGLPDARKGACREQPGRAACNLQLPFQSTLIHLQLPFQSMLSHPGLQGCCSMRCSRDGYPRRSCTSWASGKTARKGRLSC